MSKLNSAYAKLAIDTLFFHKLQFYISKCKVTEVQTGYMPSDKIATFCI